MSTPKATVVIVNYNSAKFTAKLIESIYLHIPRLIKEIIIIDNNSKESDKNELKKNINKSKILFNSDNVGFSKAVNQAIKISTTDFILLLNPDCEIIDTSIERLFTHIKKDEFVGACGGALVDPTTNQVVPSANSKANFFTGIFEFTNIKKVFPNNFYSKKFWIENDNTISQAQHVSSLCGAFILFKKTVNKTEVMFDESYFMYLEDVQFGIDMNMRGFKVIFDPKVKILHHGGKSNNSKYKTVLKYWYNSRKIYFKKNLPLLQGKFLEIIFIVEEFLLKKYHIILKRPYE